MSSEVFQITDNEPIDHSIVKRNFLKIYHQQGANLNDPDQNVEFIFGENNKNHQCRNSYLKFDITVRSPAANFDINSEIRLLKKILCSLF